MAGAQLPPSQVTCPWCGSCDSSQSPRGKRPLGLRKRCRRDGGRINAWLIWPDWFLREIRGKLPFSLFNSACRKCLYLLSVPRAAGRRWARRAVRAPAARPRPLARRTGDPGDSAVLPSPLLPWKSEEYTPTVTETQPVT